MTDQWTAEQVLALAPDAASAAAGRKLAGPGPWSDTGATVSPSALWGQCQGSGRTPYQTVVDLGGPAYRCSCPSRKFPCKHAIGLLLLWSAGHVPDADEPSTYASAWLSGRADRAGRSDSDEPRKPRDPAAAARRAQQRAARIAAGVDELARWLRDQARTGMAGADRAGYARTDPVAARLVDAQAPALANAVRRLAGVAVAAPAGATTSWPDRLLEEHALLHLLTEAHGRLDALPGPLAATVRSRTGYPVRTEDVLEEPAVRDRWNVVALRDRGEDRLLSRRVHLVGAETGRAAVVLSFAPPGQPLDASLVPGTCVDADLHFYPAAYPLRAVVGARHAEAGALTAVPGLGVAGTCRAWSAALAADPWLTELPVAVSGVAVSGEPDRGGWALVDAAGDALPVVGIDGVWTLLAVSGGRACTVVADHTPAGLVLSGAVTADGLVRL